MKALPKEEKEVLFYLFQEQKNVTEIAKKENKSRKTIAKYRDLAFLQIKNNYKKGNDNNGK